MPTYYIFRHGQTFASKYRIGYGLGIFSAPILEEGKPIIHKLGRYLKDIPSDFNVCSKLLRCRQTAAIVTEESAKEFIYDGRLNEFIVETKGHFLRRVQEVLTEIEAKKYQSVVICTHGAVISVLIKLLTGKEFGWTDLLRFPDPGILTIIKSGQVTEQIDFNTKSP